MNKFNKSGYEMFKDDRLNGSSYGIITPGSAAKLNQIEEVKIDRRNYGVSLEWMIFVEKFSEYSFRQFRKKNIR